MDEYREIIREAKIDANRYGDALASSQVRPGKLKALQSKKSKAPFSGQSLTKLEWTMRKTKQGLIVSLIVIGVLATAIMHGVFKKGFPFSI